MNAPRKPAPFGIQFTLPENPTPDQATRATRMAQDAMVRQHIQHGYLYWPSRVKTTTKEGRSPHGEKDLRMWTHTTYSLRPTRLEKALAPLVRKTRWTLSGYLARLAYDRDLYHCARDYPTSPVAHFHNWVIRTRRNPNVLQDGDLYQVVGVPVWEWAHAHPTPLPSRIMVMMMMKMKNR